MEPSVQGKLLEEILVLLLRHRFLVFGLALIREPQTDLQVGLKNELDYALCLHGLAELLQGVVQCEEFAGLEL